MKTKATIKIKKSTLTTLITIAGIVLAYIIMTVLSNAGALSNQMQGLLVPICAYAMLAVSLNLVVGILGELSLGHAGFLYVGAYTGAIFTVAMSDIIANDIVRFILGMAVGGVFAAVFGLIIGSAVLKLQGDYLAIVTLAFGEIIRSVLGNVMYISKDSHGLHFDFNDGSTLNSSDIIAKGAQGISVQKMSTFLIGIILLIITVLIVMNLTDSRAGRAIKAVRDNKIATETVGISVSKFRLMAFTISAAIAGVAGVFYAHNYATLSGSKFDFNFSINILVMVVLGGMGNIPGSVISAIVLTILPEKIRFLGEYRMVIYAVILIVMMIFSWNPKCIEMRKAASAKIKGIFKARGAKKKEVR